MNKIGFKINSSFKNDHIFSTNSRRLWLAPTCRTYGFWSWSQLA